MSVKIKNNRLRLVGKILLPIACLLWLAFIFSNSLQSGDKSSEQSASVVATVQKVVEVFSPNSPIVTATGEEYMRLHQVIRKLAHFTEFGLLGALLCWSYLVYTDRLTWIWAPATGVAIIPVIDELLQKLSEGRASMATDVLIDISGGIVGFACAWGLVWLVGYFRKRKRNGHTMDETIEEKGE